MNAVLGAAAVYGAMVGGIYLIQRSMMYYPGAEIPVPGASGVPEMSPVRVTTADGLTLVSWYRSAPPGMPTVVFFHGNAGTIGDRGFKARAFLDAGFGLVLVGYRGYGGNPGHPSEDGFYADGRAIIDRLVRDGVPLSTMALYGESLGSGIAVVASGGAGGVSGRRGGLGGLRFHGVGGPVPLPVFARLLAGEGPLRVGQKDRRHRGPAFPVSRRAGPGGARHPGTRPVRGRPRAQGIPVAARRRP